MKYCDHDECPLQGFMEHTHSERGEIDVEPEPPPELTRALFHD